MRSLKLTIVKWYFIVLATALALAPTLIVLADGASTSD